jgi:hypothetical protein
LFLLWLSFLLLSSASLPAQNPPRVVTFDLTHLSHQAPPSPLPQFSGKSPDGHTISVNSQYLMRDGKPWLPVMGEFHYTRYPERYWEEEILKMKAGGIQIVSTYVFWIHHEEVEGQFDWSGRRNLREFVELCARHGMYVYPRIGPWAHGEVRNGGLPDWLLKKVPVRVNDPVYLSYVRQYYGEIGNQLKGLLWKDGGPVIGVQLENEYSDRGPNAGAAHIAKLKELAIAAGLVVPLYTVTGWDNAVYPQDEVIPVFGGYPDEFWPGGVQGLPTDPEGVYQFHISAPPSDVGILQGSASAGAHSDLQQYPKLTAELGGGMQVAYHRRPVISADDIAPLALVQLGSGVNLLGYYMFQGGTNPDGKLTTLQESQATGYPNDLPVKSYDFQAPLREFGQMNGSFRKLKVIHQFVADLGSDLAPMAAMLPEADASTNGEALRIAARTDGAHGFLFFNNYVHNHPLSERTNVQIRWKTTSETIRIPRAPFTVASQTSFIWPVNMDLGGVLLTYATAQPVARLADGKSAYYVFTACPGVAPEFAFAAHDIASLRAKDAEVSRQSGQIYVAGLAPSHNVAIDVKTRASGRVRIVLLSPQDAEDLWKLPIDGGHLLLTSADVFAEGATIHLRSRGVSHFSFSIFPDISGRAAAGSSIQKSGADGIFTRYSSTVKEKRVALSIEKLRDAAPSDPVKMGKPFEWRHGSVATVPDNAEFRKAALWKLSLPQDALAGLSDIFLQIRYVGDIGRLCEGPKLLDDNFYNGTPWEVGLKPFAPEALDQGMELEILPLRRDAPIYLPTSSWPDFKGQAEAAQLQSVEAIPEYEMQVVLGKTGGASPQAKPSLP